MCNNTFNLKKKDLLQPDKIEKENPILKKDTNYSPKFILIFFFYYNILFIYVNY